MIFNMIRTFSGGMYCKPFKDVNHCTIAIYNDVTKVRMHTKLMIAGTLRTKSYQMPLLKGHTEITG